VTWNLPDNDRVKELKGIRGQPNRRSSLSALEEFMKENKIKAPLRFSQDALKLEKFLLEEEARRIMTNSGVVTSMAHRVTMGENDTKYTIAMATNDKKTLDEAALTYKLARQKKQENWDKTHKALADARKLKEKARAVARQEARKKKDEEREKQRAERAARREAKNAEKAAAATLAPVAISAPVVAPISPAGGGAGGSSSVSGASGDAPVVVASKSAPASKKSRGGKRGKKGSGSSTAASDAAPVETTSPVAVSA
jgi:hypothetical protein